MQEVFKLKTDEAFVGSAHSYFSLESEFRVKNENFVRDDFDCINSHCCKRKTLISMRLDEEAFFRVAESTFTQLR